MNKENEVLAIPFEVAEQEEAPKGEFQLEKVTPQIAAVYLKTNTQNRPLKSGLVKFYASEMEAGNWRAAMAAPIVFDWNGVLQDGQHRLQAIVLSGCTIEMWVARNADPNDFAVIDAGKNRSSGDIFALKGIPNANQVASIIKCYFSLCYKRTALSSKSYSPSVEAASNGSYHSVLTNRTALDLYYKCPELWQEAHKFAQSFYSKSTRLLITSFVGGLYVYLYRVKGNSLDTIKGFFEELAGGTMNNTIILLQRKLREDLQKLRERRMSDTYKQKFVAKAWNAYRKGKTLKVLRVNPDEEVFFD